MSNEFRDSTRRVPGGGGSGAGRDPGPLLDRDEFRVVSAFWADYFPDEGGDGAPEKDPRLYAAGAFRDFFLGGPVGRRPASRPPRMPEGCELETCASVSLEFRAFCEAVPMSDFAQQLQERPTKVIACVGLGLCLARHHLFPVAVNSRKRAKVTARFFGDLPLWGISDLKSNAVGKFVTVVGNVVRVSGISAMVLKASFACPKCGCEQERQFVDGKHNPPTSCPGANCKARSFELLRSTATTVDFQKIKLQEIDDDTSEAGRIPRTVEVELHEDLVDSCISGDVVTVSGVVKSVNAELASGRMNKRAKASGLYLIYLEANSLVNSRQDSGLIGSDGSNAAATSSNGDKSGGESKSPGSRQDSKGSKTSAHFTPEELEGILKIAEDDDPFGLVVSSLCPSIFGHEVVKAGLVLGLFGGTTRSSEVATRSDPHVLVVGDPGLGKSQMLHAASQASPRSVYVCGNTTSTTGLTVTLSKDGTSGEVGLEAGALVLSDQGTCCIDEFDKMGCDPHALLEAMEQQRISIAKAGVVASLSARCSVLAAANPIGGHYNRGKTVAENLKMSAALLSRFDLVFILLDRPDEQHDKRLSEHIMRTHALAADRPPAIRPPRRQGTIPAWAGGTQSSQDVRGAAAGSIAPRPWPRVGFANESCPEGAGSEEGTTLSQRLRRSTAVYSDDPIPAKLLKRYVAYARAYCHPTLTIEAARVLQKLYLTMRNEARDGRSMPITMRQLESLVRLSQARAKVELREFVTEQDAKDVVDMMQESLLEACVTDTGAIDFGRSGANGLAKQVRAFVAELTRRATHKGTAMFPRPELMDIANDLCLAISDFDSFLDVLRQECYLLKKGPRLFQLQTSDFTQATRRSQQR